MKANQPTAMPTDVTRPTDDEVREIKPCWFCGCTWVEINRPANGSQPAVKCRGCNASGPFAAGWSDEQIVAAWNTRTTPQPLIAAEPGRRAAARALADEENERVHNLANELRRIANTPVLRDAADEIERLYEERIAALRQPATDRESVRKEAWQPIESAPSDRDILVLRHDGGSPWVYGVIAIARYTPDGADKGWWDQGGEPITPPVLWKPLDKPQQPDWWTPSFDPSATAIRNLTAQPHAGKEQSDA